MVSVYTVFMTQLKKILILNIPKAIKNGLLEQLSKFTELEIICSNNDEYFSEVNPSLVIAGNSLENKIIGCPVISISDNESYRIGFLLRQILQKLKQPSLYTDDIYFGFCVFMPRSKSINIGDDKTVALTDCEVNILTYLAQHLKRAVSKDELLKNVWHYKEGIDTHTLETHIYRLRQKLDEGGGDSQILLTTEDGYSLNTKNN